MYLTIKQHDAFRTLLMGFEIPFRKYIADIVTTAYQSDDAFDTAMRLKHSKLTPSSPDFLKSVLSDACTKNTLKRAYSKFQTATSSTDEIITSDIDIFVVSLKAFFNRDIAEKSIREKNIIKDNKHIIYLFILFNYSI